MTNKLQVKAYYPNYFDDRLIAYVALRILTYFNDSQVQADIMGLSSDNSVRAFKRNKRGHSHTSPNFQIKKGIYHDAVPSGLLWSMVRRFFSLKKIHRYAEYRFFSSLRKGDIVYLWPDASLNLYQKLSAAGYLIISERINTLLASSKRILDAEFTTLGLATTHSLTDKAAEEELSCMNLASFIFSPSPGVTQSILDAGIPQSKILQTSYGLETHEILAYPQERPVNEPITAIFVGTICIRKGVHLLLKAWEKAAVKARLILVGRISPEISDMLKTSLEENPTIEHVQFVANLEPIYRSADFFILPSLEEGSPLVSYLALGAGIPLVVSPMGAGGIIENGKEGLIVDPHTEEELSGAIMTMTTDHKTRSRMALAAGAKAPYYTWEQVAIRRRELLLSALKLHHNVDSVSKHAAKM